MTGIELPRVEATLDLVRHLQESSSEFGRLVAQFGAAAPALRHIGLVQWQAGRLDAAAEAFLAALSLMPESADLWRDVANVLGAAGQIDGALGAIATSIRFDERQAQSWLLSAGLWDQKGELATAEAAYRHAILLQPSLAAAHFGLGLLLFRQKHYGQASQALATAVEWDPGNGFAQECLGHVLYIESNFDACAAAFDAAERLGTLAANGRGKRMRALTFKAMAEGRIEQALRD